MKQQLNEIKRMQQLAGIITESQMDEANRPEYPKGFIPADIDEWDEGEVIASYSAPMEGWDDEHQDTVVILKKPDGRYYVDGYLSFADFQAEGPFETESEARDAAYEVMRDIISDWNDEDEEY